MRELRRLGPRYGISLGLILVVAVIVLAAKLAGPGTELPLVNAGPGSYVSTGATGLPDDGEPTPNTPGPPSTSPGAQTPLTVARKFTEAWLNHRNVTDAQWRANVTRYTTTSVSNELSGTDPAAVPADRITGAFTQIDFGPSYVEYTVPTDSGTLTLYLQSDEGRWLVSGIDWTRG